MQNYIAYVIMDNHAHLLMEVTNETLAKIMQLIQQTFIIQHYNRIHNRIGLLFEQRYKAIIYDKDAYLLALIKYIYHNPKRAGISDINYQWSSYQEYKTYRPKKLKCIFHYPCFRQIKRKQYKYI